VRRRLLLILRWSVALGSLGLTVGTFAVPAWACRMGWIAGWQLLPAVMAGALFEIFMLGVSVALFGRLYCSVVCPLGIAQDIVRLCVGWAFPKRFSRPFSRTVIAVRLAVLGLFVVGAFFGFTGLIAPYGIFGRFLAVGVRRVGEPSVLVFAWAISMFVLVMVLSLVRARWWCNQVCPVGTLLGLFVRWSFFHVRVDEAKCVKCGLCAKKCGKGALAVREDRTIAVDTASYIACFDCVGSCRKGALKWR